ncbi:MAG: EpsG family protein [Bacteroidaceae bacterium]|nr:EpsG family protein [Bacteroidaceae bacterium]
MYTILVISALLFSLILNPPKGKNLSSVYNYAYYALWTLIFVSIAFRGEEVGRDTINYINKYFSINAAVSYRSYGGTGAYEPIYFYMNRLFGHLFGDWSQSVMVAEAVAILVGYGGVLKKYSVNPIVSTLAFLSLGLYLDSLCLLRQFIAMSVCAWSLKYVIEKKTAKFYLCVLIATGFHYTAFFWIIVYFICVDMLRYKRSDWVFVVVALIGYFYVSVFQNALAFASDRWNHYAEIETGAEGYIAFTIFFLITIVAFVNRDTIRSNYQYGQILINLNYINIIFWTMRLVTRNAERLAIFFCIAPVLLVPILFEVVEKKAGKGAGCFFKFGVLMLMAIYYVYKYTRDASLYPYQFMNVISSNNTLFK